MALTMILTGDVNLMKVADPAVPFRRVGAELRQADVVFGNLECCLTVPATHSHGNEGFFADPAVGGEALRLGGLQAVGIANNVHYGDANIMASIARLDEVGVAHTDAGANWAFARAPAILRRDGVRFGFVQHSSVYWPKIYRFCARQEFVSRHKMAAYQPARPVLGASLNVCSGARAAGRADRAE